MERARSTVHNWVQKAGLQPNTGKQPNYIALNETVIQPNDQRYCLYAAVDPDTNEFLHVRLYPTRTTMLTKQFVEELREKHHFENSVFLVDGAP
jgi:transposase-like protein